MSTEPARSPVRVEPAAPAASAAPGSVRTIALAGPLLVALGAGGWGAESLPRARLDALGLSPYAIVFAEHVLQVVLLAPFFLAHLPLVRRASRRGLVYVLLSGSVGSALGTVLYTAALAQANATVAALLLGLQPIVSTVAGARLFGERISARFYAVAAVALAAGLVMAVPDRAEWARLVASGPSLATGGLPLCAGTVLCWGFATAAGRGAMRDLPLGLAAPLRLAAGLLTMAVVLALRALGPAHDLTPALLAWPAMRWLLVLTTATGALPLVVYFAGLARTPASVAGYCELFYTLSAAVVGYAFLGGTLSMPQMAAGAVLAACVVLLRVGRAGE